MLLDVGSTQCAGRVVLAYNRIREAATSSGAQVIELHGAITDNRLVGGRDCLHPNLAGHTAIANAVHDVLTR